MNDKVGKTYDLKILSWLFGYTKPYRILLILSLIFMIFTAGLELLIPYLAKVAVDSYIYPSWREIDINNEKMGDELKAKLSDDYKIYLLSIDSKRFLIDTSEIETVDKYNLEKFGVLSKESFLVIKSNDLDPEKKNEVQNIIENNRPLFNSAGGFYFIAYSSLDKLGEKDVSILRSEDIQRVVKLALFLFLCILGIFVFSSLFTYLLNYSGHKIMHRIRTDTFSKILTLPQSYFDRNPVGRTTTRVTNDINAINEMYTSVLVQFIKDILVVLGVLVVMFFLNKNLTLFIFGLTVIIGITAILFRMRLKTVYREVRISIAKLNAFVQESVRGIVLIKLYEKEKTNFKKFKSVNNQNFKANMDQLWAYATFRPIIEFASLFAIALILWYGGLNVITLDLTLGALIAYIYYVRMLFRPIQELAEKYNIFQSAAAASENIFELMNEKVESKEGINEHEPIGKLEFNNVWFSYNKDEWVLKDVSFTINPGERVAIVGLTGSGKTTIVNLILRFYEIQKGSILLDGKNINDYSPDYIRKHVTAVFQDTFLFGKNESEINFDDNGGNFLNYTKLSSLNSSNGRNISSGEKQILSLMDAFKKDSKILILDEATSHLDAKIEKKVRQNVKSGSKQKTTIIIAHRLSNVKDTDRIIVIHKGKIIEEGNHYELINNKKLYYNLYKLQNERALIAKEV